MDIKYSNTIYTIIINTYLVPFQIICVQSLYFLYSYSYLPTFKRNFKHKFLLVLSILIGSSIFFSQSESCLKQCSKNLHWKCSCLDTARVQIVVHKQVLWISIAFRYISLKYVSVLTTSVGTAPQRRARGGPDEKIAGVSKAKTGAWVLVCSACPGDFIVNSVKNKVSIALHACSEENKCYRPPLSFCSI